MKTKIKLLIILIAIFAVTMIAGLLAGCIGEINAYEQAQQMGYTCAVTYYTNVGSFYEKNTADLKSYKTIYYKPGTPIFNIMDDATAQGLTISREKYIFTGWEYCVMEDEKPVLRTYDQQRAEYLDNGSINVPDTANPDTQAKEDEKKFLADTDGTKVFEDAEGNPIKVTLEKGDHIFIGATWERDNLLQFKLVTDEPMTVTVKDDLGQDEVKTFNNGDTFFERTFSSTNTAGRRYSVVYADSFDPKMTFEEGDVRTYLYLYRDPECTDPIPTATGASIYESFDDVTGEPNAFVYAKYLKGDWNVITDGAGLSKMFDAEEAGNYFVALDIACKSNDSFSMRDASYTFNHNVLGYSEDCTISGLTIGTRATPSTLAGGSSKETAISYSLFGTLGAEAKLTNVTLSGVDLRLRVTLGFANIYVVMCDMEEGAQLNNFYIDNLAFALTASTVNISNTQVVNFLDNHNEYNNVSNWLYGGVAADENFVSTNYEIVKVTNATLTINNRSINLQSEQLPEVD